jgi:hypothetical protein
LEDKKELDKINEEKEKDRLEEMQFRANPCPW